LLNHPHPQTPTPTNTAGLHPPAGLSCKAGDLAHRSPSASESHQSIVLLNNLPATCEQLSEGQALQIPQPTPTATALPSATLSAADATEQACEKASYVVQENDTLSSIANSYNVPMAVIIEYNGLSSETVFSGMPPTIPLCQQFPPWTFSDSHLATAVRRPNLVTDRWHTLHPGGRDRSLQWASVGTLLESKPISDCRRLYNGEIAPLLIMSLIPSSSYEFIPIH
jgi:hypothetical protein